MLNGLGFTQDLDDYGDWLFRTKLANRAAIAETQKEAIRHDALETVQA